MSTFDPAEPFAEAVFIQDGRVRWVGKASQAPDCDYRIDLGGRCVVPGLTDAHAHLLLTALSRVQLQTSAARSIGALLEVIREAAAATSPEEWIVSCDYNELLLSEGRHPTRAELDGASLGRPVLLRRVGGHLSVANSAAFDRAGIDETILDPEGGSFDREQGRLTGVLREAAETLVVRAAPPPETAALLSSLESLTKEYLSYGVVAAVDAAVGFSCGFDTEWATWQAAKESGKVGLRMGFMPHLTLEEASRSDLTVSGADPNWQVLSLKWFIDGVIGARTAALSVPYCGLQHCGGFMKSPKVLREQMVAAHRAGWQVAAHAIGDRAIELVLDILSEATQKFPRTGCRHRIEHLGVSDPAMMPRLRELGIVVATQYGFLPKLGASFLEAIDPTLADRLYRGQTLLEHGIDIAGSSDLPIGPISPYVGMAAAMSRRCGNGEVIAPAERVSLQDALGFYTVGGAKAMFHEGFRGRLAPGYRADLAVLDCDLSAIETQEFGQVRSAITLLDGQIVHSDGSIQ